MLCPLLTPLNRPPNVPHLPSPGAPSRAAGSFFGHYWTSCCKPLGTASGPEAAIQSRTRDVLLSRNQSN